MANYHVIINCYENVCYLKGTWGWNKIKKITQLKQLIFSVLEILYSLRAVYIQTKGKSGRDRHRRSLMLCW